MFYNGDGDVDDGLVNFHNKLNRNLFSKKNFKLLKTFYSNKNIHDEPEKKNHGSSQKSGDAKSKPAKTERHFNDLDDNQIEYLLEQRAHAMKNLTRKLDGIKEKFPLKEKVRPQFRKTASGGFAGLGGMGRTFNGSGSKGVFGRQRMNKTARVPEPKPDEFFYGSEDSSNNEFKGNLGNLGNLSKTTNAFGSIGGGGLGSKKDPLDRLAFNKKMDPSDAHSKKKLDGIRLPGAGLHGNNTMMSIKKPSE